MPTFPRSLLATALALAAGACGGDGDRGGEGGVPSPTPTSAAAPTTVVQPTEATTTSAPGGMVVDLQVAGGEPVGGVREVEVPLGETVVLRVRADVDDEVHVHGYDLLAPIAGGEAIVEFVADIPGQFEVELEQAGTVILDLVVR